MIYPQRTKRLSRALPTFGGLGLGLGRTYSSPSAYLLRDLFTDSDGTALTSHTMVTGAGWSSLAGTWIITSNRAVRSSSTDNDSAVAESGATNVTVTARANVGTAQSFAYVGLIARCTDNSNYWLGILNVTDTPKAMIYSRAAGTFTQRATGAVAVTASTDYDIALTVNGTTITFFVDGVQACTFASMATNLSATRCGISSSTIGQTTRTFDSFGVVSP